MDKPKEEAPYLETSPVVDPSTVVAGAVRESTVEPPPAAGRIGSLKDPGGGDFTNSGK